MKATLIVLGLAVITGFANAQPATDADLCRDTKNNPDLGIKHCTAAIDGRKANNEMLAQWYVQRGVHNADKGDYDRAVADHSTALKLDAKARHAHYYRGTAWSNKGEFDRAIADFDAAIKSRSDDPVLFHARAIELSIKGDYARAMADFDKALQLDPKAEGVHFARGRTLFYQSEFTRSANDLDTAFKEQPNIYTALWLFLARKRGGVNDAEELLERDTRRLRAGWPAPVIALYMGRTDANSVAVAATTSDLKRRREMRCEADFYVAQSHLIKGERPQAQKLLMGVQRECPKNLLEYEGTSAELRRLR
ncbi:MAG: tetratricopeptide repeat protein [Burkholderiales bacterium]